MNPVLQAARVAQRFCVETIDVDESILGVSLKDAIRAYEALGCDYKLASYVMMIAVCPLIDGCCAAGTDFSFSNPLQGLLFHWILVNFFVYGCEKKYFKFKGLSVVTAAEELRSECAQVRAASEDKYKQLVQVCKDRCIQVPNFDAYFFQFRKSKVVLQADRLATNRFNDSEYDDDDQEQESDVDNQRSEDEPKSFAREDDSQKKDVQEMDGLDNSDDEISHRRIPSRRRR